MTTYKDYELQMVVSNTSKIDDVKLQVVGLREDGGRDILKQFEQMPFQLAERAFAAPKEKPEPVNGGGMGFKIGGAFIIGLLIGGFLVYAYIKSKHGEPLMYGAKYYGAPQSMPHEQPIQPQPVRSADPFVDMIGDYDNDIFARGGDD